MNNFRTTLLIFSILVAPLLLGQEADFGNTACSSRGGYALSARVGPGQGEAGAHNLKGNQQGHVHRDHEIESCERSEAGRRLPGTGCW